MQKDLLKLLDLSKEDIIKILNTADQLKPARSLAVLYDYLRGKRLLAMIFEKNSTRTRVSFETGMYQLGGHALFLSGKSQIGRGEPIEDTARVLARYCDGIMIRTFHQEEVEDPGQSSHIPVINGLTDFCHPCQVLADLMTVREHKAALEARKLCYIGDGNNMANSLIVGGLKVRHGGIGGLPPATTLPPRCSHLPPASRTSNSPWSAPPSRRPPGPTWSLPTCGPPWARRRSVPSAGRLCRLSVNDRLVTPHQPGVHGTALPARPPWGGDHGGGL